jgi:hypothetical protein
MSQNLDSNLFYYIFFVLWNMQDCYRRQLYILDKMVVSFVSTIVRYGLPCLGIVALGYLVRIVTEGQIWIILSMSALISIIIQIFLAPAARTDWSMVRRACSDFYINGRALFFQSVLQIVADNIIFLTAGKMLESSEIGIWRSLQSINSFFNPLLMSLESLIPARASRIYRDHGVVAGNGWLLWQFCVVASLFILLGSILALFAEPITKLLFPSVPSGWTWIAQWSCAIPVLIMAKYFVTLYARMLHIYRGILLAAGMNFVMSGLLAYPLARYFGIQGAVIGSVGLLFLSLVIMMGCVRIGPRPVAQSRRP